MVQSLSVVEAMGLVFSFGKGENGDVTSWRFASGDYVVAATDVEGCMAETFTVADIEAVLQQLQRLLFRATVKQTVRLNWPLQVERACSGTAPV